MEALMTFCAIRGKRGRGQDLLRTIQAAERFYAWFHSKPTWPISRHCQMTHFGVSAVCCLLSAVCCLLSAVCCLLSAVCCQRCGAVTQLLSRVSQNILFVPRLSHFSCPSSSLMQIPRFDKMTATKENNATVAVKTLEMCLPVMARTFRAITAEIHSSKDMDAMNAAHSLLELMNKVSNFCAHNKATVKDQQSIHKTLQLHEEFIQSHAKALKVEDCDVIQHKDAQHEDGSE